MEVLIMNNQLTVIGRIGQNPKVRTFGDSTNKVVKFSIAVTEYSITYADRL